MEKITAGGLSQYEGVPVKPSHIYLNGDRWCNKRWQTPPPSIRCLYSCALRERKKKIQDAKTF